jgi:hypothetical protein
MSGDTVPAAIVTLHVWRVPTSRLPAVAWRLATDRRALRRLPGVTFAKLLGTSRSFSPTEPDLTRWAALLVWADQDAAARFDATPPARHWRSLAARSCRLDLRPLTSRGAWAGRDPFQPRLGPDGAPPDHPERAPADGVDRGLPRPALAREGAPLDAMTLVLTRARLRVRAAGAFWRAQAAPARAAEHAPGLLAALGVGEAPLGYQGTVSLWRRRQDLVEFAYRHPAHRRVVAETPVRRWYAEELFARFAVEDLTGDRDVLGWRGEDRTGSWT